MYDVQKYAFDRLCDRRDQYPRVTLMTVAQPGLERRGLWSGEIERFAKQQAPAEPNWQLAFREWHRQLVEASAPPP